MNAARSILDELQVLGVEVIPQGGNLLIRPASKVPPQLKERLKAQKAEVLTALRLREVIPEGAVLLAPRYDGRGRPLPKIPACWCCCTPWELDRLQEDGHKVIAWLKPGCTCLDTPQALACCGLCVEHCTCSSRRELALKGVG